MKKTNPKKLTLSRETLTALTAYQVQAAKGGVLELAADANALTGDSKNVCCC
jgi:hypothetical protein